jgi:predicted AAA+ superfamily ATPase
MIRAQKNTILKELEKKIVLLVGSRQSGKTYLAKDIAIFFAHSLYGLVA